LGVQVQAGTVRDATSQAADRMNQVIKALKSKGIEDKDIRTSQFNISPIYSQVPRPTPGGTRPPPEEPVITGYRVDNMVTAKMRKLDRVGEVIDSAVEAGGDATRIRGISFQVENTTPLLKQARDLAVKDALDKARQLADGAGVKLGKATLISENTGFAPSPVAFAAAERSLQASAPTPISPGEQQVSTTVQMVFDIQ
jgi:uncharacterized protein YggE